MRERAVCQLGQAACRVSFDDDLVLGRRGSARGEAVSHVLDTIRFPLEGQLETAVRGGHVDPKGAKHEGDVRCSWG